MNGIPKLSYPTADVRDVAKAHLEAAIRPEAANRRFIIAHENVPLLEMANIIVAEYGKVFGTKNYEMKKWMVDFGAWFSADAKVAKKNWGVNCPHDNAASK